MELQDSIGNVRVRWKDELENLGRNQEGLATRNNRSLSFLDRKLRENDNQGSM